MARKQKNSDDDDEEAPVGAAGGEDEAWDESRGKAGRKKLLVFIGAFVLIVCGAVASAYFTGVLDPILRASGALDEGEELKFSFATAKTGYFELPELLVNLNTSEGRSQYLKIRVNLEVRHAADIGHVQFLMPRILDRFQVYLRELRIDDIQSTRGLHRLRGELLARVNEITAPAQVNDVLFKEVLVQ